ncbi:hypothetical protein [Parasedimentitalea psychrophila]|uniref:Uncharacterized protein n=1 Tax=Parasedimentitalea psychrophila TaxID=2997337 RepID=A0A9Y2KUS6_9RHOB|nr:hypothetical protein [Parasedimentitalea psychrophila]WIY23525.1 hypothetical protein QPJ95_12740 [Parasedimentitalea psychrophila]
MKSILTAAVCAGIFGVMVPLPAQADLIERACRQSDRTAASRSVCGCIQQVANASLTRSERKKVAGWFDDPHQAQVVRQSSRSGDERLWLRYKAFGERAARTCS